MNKIPFIIIAALSLSGCETMGGEGLSKAIAGAGVLGVMAMGADAGVPTDQLANIGATTAISLMNGDDAESYQSALQASSSTSSAAGNSSNSSVNSEGYSKYQYSFTCPSGSSTTIPVPYKTERDKQLKMKLAYTGSCNQMDEFAKVQAQCSAEFGHPYCQH